MILRPLLQSLILLRPLLPVLRYVLCAIVVLAPIALVAGEEIPGRAQSKPIALVNGIVHTVSAGTLQKATVVFDGGRIVAVGANAAVPADARVVDCTGKHIYPGFITSATSLGLVEIDAVRATRDNAEVGEVNPNARAETAYNPDSELIPTVRSNGVLLANVIPEGGLVAGMSSLMRLDGWTREDIAVQARSGMVLNWPSMHVVKAWWMKKSPEEQKKAIDANVRAIKDLFSEARAYSNAQRNNVDTNRRDIRYESMRAVFEQNLPVIVFASTRLQMESALEFKRAFNLRMIIAGATEAPLMLSELQREKVGILLQRVHSLPSHDEDGYDDAYTLPSKLAAAGIPFALTDGGSWQQRNLAFNAGTAVAYGLAESDAEKAITLWPAQIFGIDGSYGSIEQGKSATLFVSTGNALDAKTQNVELAFIDGKEVDLDNRHTRLSKKYRERFKP